jgi:spiro-SPASM protein
MDVPPIALSPHFSPRIADIFYNMRSLTVMYGGSLAPEAFEPVFSGKCALDLALERGASFPGVAKTVLLGGDDFDAQAAAVDWTKPAWVELIKAPVWTKKSLLEHLAALSAGYDLTYYAWADCPLLDPVLTESMMNRHVRYAAEYSYADGWPYGFAPEIVSPGTAGILSKIIGAPQPGPKAEGAPPDNDNHEPVERDALFSVIQKDINAFDIETEISPVELRNHRLSLSADSRRNLLLLTRLMEAGLKSAADAERIITKRPELLRTLPAFFAIQVSGGCPQSCELCPYPQFGGVVTPVTERRDFMAVPQFEALLDSIVALSGDGVIDLSLWGELSLHPQKMDLIGMVLARPALSLIIETSGLGWKTAELEALAAAAAGAPKRTNRLLPDSPLSWIVSLDAADPEIYRKIRGPGYEEAITCAKKLLALFPKDAYVQAVRVKGREDDIEKFYRSWKAASPGVTPHGGANSIIQKYDDFCGFLPKKQASDLSPVKRQPCWHLMRDLNILLDGRVSRCREDYGGAILGNAFTESLGTLWSRGDGPYGEQCSQVYGGICAECDEYYTYNF